MSFQGFYGDGFTGLERHLSIHPPRVVPVDSEVFITKDALLSGRHRRAETCTHL